MDEYIIDAIHIFKNEKQAQKFIDEHLKYFADQDKVVIAEYPQTVNGFFESKESVGKSIEESLDIDQFTNLFLDTFSVIFLFSQRKNIKKALGYKENESIIKTLIMNVKKALEEMNDDSTIN